MLFVSQLPRRHFNGSSRAAFLTLSHVHWITFVDSAALFLCLLNSPSGILPPRAVLGRAKLEALVHVINKQSCRDPTLMFLVRRLVLVCLEKDVCFKAKPKHIPGVCNILADALSRLKLQTFKQVSPMGFRAPGLPP